VELIGVMILFGIYGSFDIGSDALDEYCATADFDCDTDPDLIPANITSLSSFSGKSQSYGIASFAVLFLGACWLLAPFVFNTDGLVLQKSRVDIANWFAWMMRARHKDDDLEGESTKSASSAALQPKDGWDDWWKSDVDLMVNLGPMGRLTYCIRELRHPLAMYYVFLTEFTLPWLALLFGAMGATWALLWFGNRVHHCLSKHRKLKSLTIRGMLYMVCVIGGIMLAPLIVGSIAGWSVLKCFTFSISMILGFNAIVQYGLAFNGIMGMEVAMWSPVMALGFLMDMIVGLFLVIPLFFLSLLPFMRILQTRAMYNGGFSRSLSSGSEVAASLCILLGLLGGFIYGFMISFLYTLGYVNDSSDNFMNRSFYHFVTTKLSNDGSEMLSFMENGYLKITCATASVVGVLLSLLIGRVLGRRLNMAIGGGLVFVSLGLNFIPSTSIIIVSCGMAAAGTAMMAMNYLLYSFEICTKGWRGKSVTIFLMGSMIGYFAHSLLMANTNATTIREDWDNNPVNMWRFQPLFVEPELLAAFFGVLWFVPESPVWLLAHHQEEQARVVLIRLRRRQNVNPEVALIQNELAQTAQGNNFGFRLAFVFSLQAVFGLIMSQALLIRRTLMLHASDTGSANNYWLVYFALCCATGFAFGSFLVDNVRRKTILKEFLPFVSLVAFTCGIIGAVSSADGGLVQTLLCLLYIAAGLSLMSVTWLSALEMFPASRRPLFWTLSLCVFHAAQIVVYLLDPSFALAHFILSGCCGSLTIVLFMFCASTKLGAIQLKSEKRRQKAMREAAPEEQEQAEEVDDNAPDDLHRQQTRIAQTSAAMNRSAGTASNPAASAANVNFGAYSSASNLFGPPASSAASQAQANASQFGFSGAASAAATGNQYVGGFSAAPSAPDNQFGFARLESSDASSAESSATTARRRQMTHLSSTFDFEAEFEDEHIEDMRANQIGYPRGQPRSVSFLQSQRYPDADLHAETQSVRL
ncbi:hypothetical protein BBJ28_00015992, partial [Nothophytophthora sp. Chile5]